LFARGKSKSNLRFRFVYKVTSVLLNFGFSTLGDAVPVFGVVGEL
jgi:hypothetical protein